jgi:hypothetical protein
MAAAARQSLIGKEYEEDFVISRFPDVAISLHISTKSQHRKILLWRY